MLLTLLRIIQYFKVRKKKAEFQNLGRVFSTQEMRRKKWLLWRKPMWKSYKKILKRKPKNSTPPYTHNTTQQPQQNGRSTSRRTCWYETSTKHYPRSWTSQSTENCCEEFMACERLCSSTSATLNILVLQFQRKQQHTTPPSPLQKVSKITSTVTPTLRMKSNKKKKRVWFPVSNDGEPHKLNLHARRAFFSYNFVL